MLTDRTPQSEFYSRWQRAQEICRVEGVEALVVWGRGGGTVDASEDVVYLANHYAGFPLCHDLEGAWSGLSSAAVILPAEGEPTLIRDAATFPGRPGPIEDVRPTNFVPDTVAQTLIERGFGSARVGLVAGNTMVLAPYRRLIAAAPKVEFVAMDNAIESLRVIKSPYEFQLLREAADIGNEGVLAMMRAATKPGTTEAEAVAVAYKTVIERGAAVWDAAVAAGPHTAFYNYGQMPEWTTRKLETGDMFHCDMYGAAVEGYIWDFARTTVTGGRPNSAQEEVIDGAIASIDAGVATVRAGVKVGEVAKAVRDTLIERGVEMGYPLYGHSYGLRFEAPWLLLDNNQVIEAGMAIAIETMAGIKGVGNAKYEQNVLIHEDSVELLSTCPPRPWL